MQFRWFTISVTAVAALALLGPRVATADGEERAAKPGFFVIVHQANSTHTLDRKFVADAFLKKTTRWSSDVIIRPVDQKPERAPRARFSHVVLRRSVSAVLNYWRQLIFSGRGVPPPQLDGDREVVAFVREHRGAIGYVSPDAELEGVHVVEVR